MEGAPRVTVSVPSYNQGRYLANALESIFAQALPVEVFVLDAGSTDESLDVIRRFQGRLAGWRSHADAGQSAAVNEGIAQGRAPFVCWLNSDDWLLPGGLQRLLEELVAHPEAPMAYGRVWNHVEASGQRRRNLEVHAFSEGLLAQFNIIAQPATLMRRDAWEAVGGVDESLHMAMDYDLWWKLFKRFGAPRFVDAHVAVNRRHADTKTSKQRRLHYREAMAVVRKYHGRVPLKWWLAQPIMVWYRALIGR
jgi:glycosyltransferase involved in cell wall biosynthesis